MADEVKCGEKHTAYQPPDEEWLCPNCGVDNSAFWVEENAAGAADGCDKLHERDICYCTKCERGWSGKAFAGKLAKRKNLVTCPMCKGHGTVAGPLPTGGQGKEGSRG